MAIQETLPDRLGPYRLLYRIGEGGMGFVHLASDSENRPVAVKVLRPQVAGDATARRRLGREVETMRRVRSPFVAEVIDADVTGDVPYIVTRFVPGRTLDEAVAAHGPLRGEALPRLAYGLACALAAVHAAGVVHRDLKPGNVMMIGDDPVMIDFGIAQAADATRLTQTGMFMGTPGYLAPEVIEGQPSGPSADVHSWGATVAFAARGEPPYGTGPYEAVFFRILRGDANLDGIAGALHQLIAAALTREPAQRPTAARLADQLRTPNLTASPAPVQGLADVPGPTRREPGRQLTSGHQAPAQRQAAYQRPREVADLLPPVRYAPAPVGGAGQPRPAGQDLAPRDGARRPRAAPAPRPHRLLAMAGLVIAVAISLVLPVAGTVAVLAVIAILRTADRARGGLAARRSARGPRVTDPFLVAASAPWGLARSVLVTLVVAPLLLFIAGVAAMALIVAMGEPHLQLTAAYAAGVFMALNCVGPASRAPRRELNRILTAVTPTRLTAAAVTLMLGAFAAAMVSLAMLKAPTFWPVPDPHSLLVHLPGAGLITGGIHGGVLHLPHVGPIPAWKIPLL